MYKVDEVDRFTRKQTRIRFATVIGRAARMRTGSPLMYVTRFVQLIV